MPKAVFVAPPLNTADLPDEGADVLITEAREVINQWTTIGTTKRGIGLTVTYRNKEYSQLFSIDKDILTGSIGRILISIGIEDTDAEGFKEKLQTLVGRTIRVQMRGGKLYWYP